MPNLTLRQIPPSSRPTPHPADPLDAALSRLANSPDPLVATWAGALLDGEMAIPTDLQINKVAQ